MGRSSIHLIRITGIILLVMPCALSSSGCGFEKYYRRPNACPNLTTTVASNMPHPTAIPLKELLETTSYGPPITSKLDDNGTSTTGGEPSTTSNNEDDVITSRPVTTTTEPSFKNIFNGSSKTQDATRVRHVIKAKRQQLENIPGSTPSDQPPENIVRNQTILCKCPSPDITTDNDDWFPGSQVVAVAVGVVSFAVSIMIYCIVCWVRSRPYL